MSCKELCWGPASCPSPNWKQIKLKPMWFSPGKRSHRNSATATSFDPFVNCICLLPMTDLQGAMLGLSFYITTFQRVCGRWVTLCQDSDPWGPLGLSHTSKFISYAFSLELAFGTVLKMLLGTPTSRISVPRFESQICFQFQFGFFKDLLFISLFFF